MCVVYVYVCVDLNVCAVYQRHTERRPHRTHTQRVLASWRSRNSAALRRRLGGGVDTGVGEKRVLRTYVHVCVYCMCLCVYVYVCVLIRTQHTHISA